MLHEDQVWVGVHNYQKYTFDHQESDDFADQLVDQSVLDKPVTRAQLMKLRQRKYTKIRFNQSVKRQLQKYESLNDEFVHRFGAQTFSKRSRHI